MKYPLHTNEHDPDNAAQYVMDNSRDPSENSCRNNGNSASSGRRSPTHVSSPSFPPGENQRGSPTRGVIKVPSLRRGAAAYAQLLQSAVLASIESKADDGGSSDSFEVPANGSMAADLLSAPPAPSSDTVHPGSPGCGSSDGEDRRHKRRFEDNDFPPHLPRRTHSRRNAPDDIGDMVLSHHDGENFDSDGMDVS